MSFTFYTNETEEVLELIKNSFNLDIPNKEIKLDSNQRILLIKDDNKVVGATLITLKRDPIESIKSFYLDYVCIDSNYRSHGLGEMMLNEIIKLAKEEKIDTIQLTSNKKRIVARELYKKMGMEIIDTDLFKLEL